MDTSGSCQPYLIEEQRQQILTNQNGEQTKETAGRSSAKLVGSGLQPIKVTSCCCARIPNHFLNFFLG